MNDADETLEIRKNKKQAETKKQERDYIWSDQACQIKTEIKSSNKRGKKNR